MDHIQVALQIPGQPEHTLLAPSDVLLKESLLLREAIMGAQEAYEVKYGGSIDDPQRLRRWKGEYVRDSKRSFNWKAMEHRCYYDPVVGKLTLKDVSKEMHGVDAEAYLQKGVRVLGSNLE